MIAICPVGPPKEINPSLSQKRNASPKLGRATTGLSCFAPGGLSIRLSKLLHKVRKPLRERNLVGNAGQSSGGDIRGTLQKRQKSIAFAAWAVLFSARCRREICALACLGYLPCSLSPVQAKRFLPPPPRSELARLNGPTR